MATFNFELNSRPSKKGTYAVLLRITEKQKHKRVKTGVELKSKAYWNPKAQEVRKSEPDFKSMNDKLRKVKAEAQEAESKLEDTGKNITSRNVASTMKAGKKAFSFIQYAEGFAQRTLETGNYRTYQKYFTMLVKLKLFINGVKPEGVKDIPSGWQREELAAYLKRLKEDLLFSDITTLFISNFKTYLSKIPNVRHPNSTLHQNTISKQLDMFKSLFHHGMKDLKDEGLNLKSDPFFGFEYGTIDTNKEKLTEGEIEALKALSLKKGSSLWHTRNCFMLAFYCAGIRSGDLIQLRGTDIRQENGGWRMCYRMDKTGAAKEILLVPEALQIIGEYVDLQNRTSAYILPMLDNKAPYAKAGQDGQLPYEVKMELCHTINSKNVILNKNLKVLARLAGIEKNLSMHIARHSFANIARQKGANVFDISKSLGHSKLAITEHYLSKFDTSSEDATLRKVFSSSQPNEEALLNQLNQLSPEALASLLNRINRPAPSI